MTFRRVAARFLLVCSALLGFQLLAAPDSTSAASPAGEGAADFGARFANPPPESRIFKIIHGWPDAAETQDNWIRRFTAQGFGGVVCNVSFDRYLESDAHWEAFKRAVRAARQAGLALWLYDERGYPSGNAGGLVLEQHPEWEARGLLVSDTESGGGAVELAAPPGTLVLAAAYPVRAGRIDLENPTDLTDRIRDGGLHWEAPPGQWRVMVISEDRLYEGTHAEGNLAEKMPYVNLLQPEPIKRFIELTHDRYARHFGGNLGKDFVATFTDEPSLMSCFLKPMPWRPLPWAPNLPGEFEKRRHHPLAHAMLPALIADAGPVGTKFRYDFWQTVGELVSENYFGQIQERCEHWNIPSGGHLLMEEGLVTHVPFYGDFFRCIRRLGAPSIDCLTSLPPEVPWYIARLLASAAELEGRRIVMSETSDHGQVYRPAGDTRPKRVVTGQEIRGTCNRLFVGGVNTITSYFSFTDLDDAALRRLNEWVGRCATLLTGGHQVADVAVVYPAETLWTKFTPARLWANESVAAAKVESVYRAAADSLFASQRDFTFVDSRALEEAKVEGGALVHGDLRWRAVVLPAVDTLPLAAWENVARFVRTGGVLIGVGALPLNSESEFPSGRVQALARELFGEVGNEPRVAANDAGGAGIYLPLGSGGLLPLVLDGVLERDVQVAELGSPVRATHRRIDGHEVFFLINDSPRTWEGEVKVAAGGRGERWDPAGAEVAGTNLNSRVTLRLEPYGAVGLRFPEARTPARHPARSGALPNLIVSPTPAVTPTVSCGEFVRSKLALDEARATKDQPAWRASATLTKGQVDTFLFVRFNQPAPVDLSGADCLVIDTWVPQGQRTPSQILVIVQEQGGGDFLASSGRPLGEAGHVRVFLPFSRLEQAGWSQDADGLLDRSRVGDIRVGWGGYLGTEGETIEFSVAVPQVGRVGHRVE